MFPTHKLLAAMTVLCGVFASREVCYAQDTATITIGGVKVSGDSALARREHPRLLFTRAELPRLRERLKHPRIAQDLISQCDFAAHTPEYYLFHYRPWTGQPQVVHVGVNAMRSHWEAVTPAKSRSLGPGRSADTSVLRELAKSSRTATWRLASKTITGSGPAILAIRPG